MAHAGFHSFRSRAIGWFFIAATISAIIGLKLYDPVLTANDFVVAASNHYTQIVFGAVNELVLVVTAMGTGIMLYPVLKRYDEDMATGYLCFRILEVVFIMIGIVSVLGALSVSQLYINGVIANKNAAQIMMLGFIGVHKWVFILGPNFILALNTFIYSYVFYQAEIIPKNLSGMGLLASCMIMVAAILEMFGVIEQMSLCGIVLALPIALYELILAVWLLMKGFTVINETGGVAVMVAQ